MARRVFFSFHFDRDVWRANQVRNANVVLGTDTAGFFDHSEYLKAKAQGDDAIRRMILGHLNNTSVTVVLIGTLTWTRPGVQLEIKEVTGAAERSAWRPHSPPQGRGRGHVSAGHRAERPDLGPVPNLHMASSRWGVRDRD
jgi:MTH538 TIR-like domain (DUF1863)